ncbi:NAD-dependent epimerase/dehydratase family protein [Rhodoferax lacus]|uniref:NAD-dependent epimerase/dehydratase family protein n=1 Tax=Rhodoferax lacus TaxID=2184758 RepID=UPI0018F370D5|nr:NAD(P)-dependent oxidoreductase [Rhodoferax lacus]
MSDIPAPLCLITGGSGFLGINLTRSLLSRGYAIRTLDIEPFNFPEQSQIDARLGDVRSVQQVDSAMCDVCVVVHCAAALPLASPAEIASTTIDGTHILLEAAKRHGVPRFVFISTTAVYGIPNHYPVFETDPLQGVGPYGCAKIRAEQWCISYRSPSLSVTVLRPKSFVGAERLGAFELLFDWAFDGRNFPVLGTGDNLYQLLDVEDLCEAILLCITLHSDRVSTTFNVGAKQFGTLRQSFQAVLDRAGHGGRVVSLPQRPAQWLLCLLELMRLSPLYRWIYASASHTSVVSTRLIEANTGFSPRYSNVQALVRNYDWYVAHRKEIQSRLGITHRAPWRHGVLALAKYLF